MSAARWEAGLWGATAFMLVIAALGSRAPATGASEAGVLLPAPSTPRVVGADSIARLADYLALSDPFRLERKPSSVAYRPELEGLPPTPVAPRPNLRVTGIIGGPPWQAILDGVPGREGSVVVRAGDVIAEQGLTVRAVRRDTVVVHGRDTIWVLTVSPPR